MRRYFPFVQRALYDRAKGVNDKWWVTTTLLGKENSPGSECLLANEIVCGEIASFLRLPIAPFALMRNRGPSKAMFTSLKFTDGDAPPPDCEPVQCVNLDSDLCTGILLFDILVVNSDRHSGNVYVDSRYKPTEIIIGDHDRALFCIFEDRAETRLQELWDSMGITGKAPTQGARHVFLDTLDTADFIWKWISRIGQILDWFIDEVCEEVTGRPVKRRLTKMLAKFLKHRRNILDQLVLGNKAEFTAIKNWGLLP